MASAFLTIDSWLGRAAMYGGRIDSDFDQRILDAFVDGLFTPHAYHVDFVLVPSANGERTLLITDATKLENFLSWAQRLPDREPPS